VLVLLTALATGALAGIVALPHCVAMCGPYAGFACASTGGDATRAAAPRTPWYLGGRAAGYATLGAIAGGTGGVADTLLPPTWATVLLAALLAGGMLALAWRLARSDRAAATLVTLGPRRPERAPLRAPGVALQRGLTRAVTVASRYPAVLGLLMASFPCGALYAALMVAASTASAWAGAASMLGFALTSGVALGLSGWIARASVALDRHTRFALSAALVVGAVILVARPLLLVGEDEPPTCDHGATSASP